MTVVIKATEVMLQKAKKGPGTRPDPSHHKADYRLLLHGDVERVVAALH